MRNQRQEILGRNFRRGISEAEQGISGEIRMGRRQSGIKVYQAETEAHKRDRGSLSLFVLQSVVLSLLMALWWNAFLSVFRLPVDKIWLYGITAAAVILLGALNRRFGAAAVIAGIAGAAVLLWYNRDTLIRLYMWIEENYETLFSVQTAGNRAFSYVAVLAGVPVLEILLCIQRTGKGKVLAGVILCAPFITAACAGWFQTGPPSWFLILGAAAYFATLAPGAGRTGKGLFMWENAVFAVAVCAVLVFLSCRAGLFLDAGRETESSFYFRMRGILTTEVVGKMQDLAEQLSGEDETETEPDQTKEVKDDEEPDALSADDSTQSDEREKNPGADDLFQDEAEQENTGGTDIFEGPSSDSQEVTDLGSIARFVPSSEGTFSIELDKKPESTVYYPENWGIGYFDDTWEMTSVGDSESGWPGNGIKPEECMSYPDELEDTLSVLCSDWADGTIDEVSREISRELHQRAVYDTEPGAPPAGEEFLYYFLFENHKGFCVHFATAATLMYRYCGYPARYAEGYAIPASAFHDNENGTYEAQVTGDMGHAWCQVYDKDTGGWTDMEHTPSAPRDTAGQPPAASSDYKESIGERIVHDVLPVLIPVCLAFGLCAVLFFAQAAVRTARREQRFRKKKGGEGIREMYAAVIKTAKFQGEKIKEPLNAELTEHLYELYPELGEKEWQWMYACVMRSLFYHLDNEKDDWMKMRGLYKQFRKAAMERMSRGQRWRYRYVRCL